MHSNRKVMRGMGPRSLASAVTLVCALLVSSCTSSSIEVTKADHGTDSTAEVAETSSLGQNPSARETLLRQTPGIQLNSVVAGVRGEGKHQIKLTVKPGHSSRGVAIECRVGVDDLESSGGYSVSRAGKVLTEETFPCTSAGGGARTTIAGLESEQSYLIEIWYKPEVADWAYGSFEKH